MSEESILKKLADAILSFDEEVAKTAAQEALDAGVDPLTALEKGLKGRWVSTLLVTSFPEMNSFYPTSFWRLTR